MRIAKRFTTPLLTLALLVGPAATASAQNGNPAQQQLVQSYVTAVRAHDPARVLALFHPKVLACRNDSTRDYFDYLASQNLRQVPPAQYKISITPLPASGPAAILPATMFKYPVQPTHQLQLDWNNSPTSSVTVMRNIAAQDGRWFMVEACPSAEGMKTFRDGMARRQQQQAHAQALAAKVKDPLRSQLKALLKQGRKIDAAHKYQAATGADLTTAVQVVDILESATK